MDFNKIKKIKKYADQVNKFRKLEQFNKLKNNEFSIEMKKIFPKFSKESPKIFENVVNNYDLSILNLMFNKLDLIEQDFQSRKKEVKYIEPVIKDLILYINKNNNVSKKEATRFATKYHGNFPKKYPVIIERLVDKDYNIYEPEQLLLEQIKFKHEVQIGEVLAQQYLYPVLNKK
tara:strand:- start:220 stop:744 length:525 start_codon:yes stop_codon:yes gene_type:complete